MLCGGEALHVVLASRLLSRGHPIWNLYGQTETAIWSSYYYVDEVPDEVSTLWQTNTPIQKFYILDEHQKAGEER